MKSAAVPRGRDGVEGHEFAEEDEIAEEGENSTHSTASSLFDGEGLEKNASEDIVMRLTSRVRQWRGCYPVLGRQSCGETLGLRQSIARQAMEAGSTRVFRTFGN